MAYATKQDLIDRFGEAELIQLTDRAEPPANAVDDTVVARALTDAENLIDGHLVPGGYILPLSPVPDLVRRIACDVARYYLHKDAATEQVRKSFEDAMKQLAGISRGDIKLSAASVAAPGSGGDPIHEAPEPVFTRESLKDY